MPGANYSPPPTARGEEGPGLLVKRPVEFSFGPHILLPSAQRLQHPGPHRVPTSDCTDILHNFGCNLQHYPFFPFPVLLGLIKGGPTLCSAAQLDIGVRLRLQAVHTLHSSRGCDSEQVLVVPGYFLQCGLRSKVLHSRAESQQTPRDRQVQRRPLLIARLASEQILIR